MSSAIDRKFHGRLAHFVIDSKKLSQRIWLLPRRFDHAFFGYLRHLFSALFSSVNELLKGQAMVVIVDLISKLILQFL